MSVPHDTFAGRNIMLKGTSSIAGPQVRATWSFGDGTAPETFTITNRYDASIRHVYYGAPGTVFRATLTVKDAATGESGSAEYLVAVREKNLESEVNVAIDEGLWYLHKTMNRTAIGDQPAGTWQGDCGAACDSAGSANAANVLAFERHGHLESGDSANPYTETVARALKTLLHQLQDAGDAPDSLVLEAIDAAKAPRTRTAGGRTYEEILQQAKMTRRVKPGDWIAHGGAESPATAARFLLELARAGVGRPETRWVETESALRSYNSLDLDAQAVLDLSEAMRTHAPGGIAQPLAYLHAASPEGLPDLDWYAAEAGRGDATDGVARILVNRQNPAGYWSGHASRASASGETAHALLTLNATPILLGTVSTATNVTRQVFFNFSGSLLGASVTVTNISGSALPGPLALAVFQNCAVNCGAVNLLNQSGTYNGDPYVLFAETGLPAGQSATVPLQFAALGKDIPLFAVYSGAFPPSALGVSCPANTAETGTAYSSSLVGAGGVLAYTYSINGLLPAGLNLDAATGAVTGTPTTPGVVNFTGVVTDSTARAPVMATANCTITVSGTPTNTKPTVSAVPPSLSVLQNSGFTPVQLNGSDVETAAANLSFTITQAPANGVLRQGATVLTAGSVLTGGSPATVTYQPNAGFTGSDSFRFKATDRGAPDNCTPGPSCAAALDSDVLNVPITVNPPSGGTTVTNVTGQVNLNFSFASQVMTVSNTTGSPIPGPLTLGVFLTCLNAPCGVPPLLNPTGVFNGDPYLALSSGGLNPGQSASITLQFPSGFKLSFGIVVYSGIFPPAPLSVACPSSSAVVGLAYSSSLTGGGGVLAYTFSIVGSLPAGLTLNGTTGAITGTPTTLGPVTFTAAIADSAGRAPETASTSCTINVTTNNPPTGSSTPPSLTVLEDAAATPVQLTASDTETPPANLTFTITQLPAHGMLREGATVLTAGSVLSTGSPATVTYQPNANFNGSDSFQFKVTDRGNPDNCTPGPTCAPPRDSSPVTVPITVTAVNDAPSFTLSGTPQRAALSGGPQTVSGFATNISAGPPDESGQTLTFIFTGNTNPAIFAAGPAISANGTLTYTPAGSGTSTLTVVLQDNGGTANGGVDTSAPQTFTITVNTPPVSAAQSVATPEDTALPITLAASDVNGDTLTYTIVTGPAHGTALPASGSMTCSGTPSACTASITYTPAANYNGPDSFTFKANDGLEDSATATVTITVTPVNDAPTAIPQTTATPESTGIQITLAGTDLETAAANLVFTVTTAPSHGTLSGTAPNLTYTPAAGYFGPDNFQFNVTDRGDPDNCGAPSAGCSAALDSTPATVSITVSPVNTPPTATSQTVTVTQNTPTAITLTGTDAETAPANLSFTVTGKTSHGMLTGSAPNLTYTPNPGFVGTDSFTFWVTDRGKPDNCGVPSPTCAGPLMSAPALVNIVVQIANTAPTATGQIVTTTVDTPLPITLTGSDVETAAANLTFTVTTNPAHGTLSGTAPNLTYTPNAGYIGPDIFQFKVTDRGNPDNCGTPSAFCAAPMDSAAATIVIIVNP